jgi:hypothetical protein
MTRGLPIAELAAAPAKGGGEFKDNRSEKAVHGYAF